MRTVSAEGSGRRPVALSSRARAVGEQNTAGQLAFCRELVGEAKKQRRGSWRRRQNSKGRFLFLRLGGGGESRVGVFAEEKGPMEKQKLKASERLEQDPLGLVSIVEKKFLLWRELLEDRNYFLPV